MKIDDVIKFKIADGRVYPPFVLYPGKKQLNPSLYVDLPPRGRASNTENGWMTEDSFYGWMKQLVKWLLPPTQRGHVVLLLDGHS